MKLLYCLKCVTPGRYYVGYTEVWRWDERHREHTSGQGALWTRKHGVEKVMWKREVPDKDARRLEDVARRYAVNSGLTGAEAVCSIFARTCLVSRGGS